MTAPRAIGIIRVSQRDTDAQSPEVQRRALRAMAAEHGWSLADRDIHDENLDANGVKNVSGGAVLAGRPKLAAAVAAIESGEAQVLAAENFDRLFRNVDMQREVIRRVEAAGGEVWRRAGRISMKRAADKAMATMEGTFAEYVKDAAAERSFDAVELAIEQGKIPWSQTPPGYLRNPDSTLAVDPELAPVIAEAFARRAAGATIAQVRQYLRGHGIVKSYHGTQHLLRDRLYLGEIHFGTHAPNLAAHEPIVDRAMFDAVARRKDARGPRPKSPRLLARQGILRCETCGSRMVVGTQTQNGRSYPFYRCPPVGDCGDRVTISATLVEKLVSDAVRAAVVGQGRLRADRGRAQAAEALDRAQREYDAYLAIVDPTEPAAVERIGHLKAARDAAREAVEQLGPEPEGGDSIPFDLSTPNHWKALTTEAKQRLIRAFVRRVDVRKGGKGAERVTIHMVGE